MSPPCQVLAESPGTAWTPHQRPRSSRAGRGHRVHLGWHPNSTIPQTVPQLPVYKTGIGSVATVAPQENELVSPNSRFCQAPLCQQHTADSILWGCSMVRQVNEHKVPGIGLLAHAQTQ